jgi:hypothetical protein
MTNVSSKETTKTLSQLKQQQKKCIKKQELDKKPTKVKTKKRKRQSRRVTKRQQLQKEKIEEKIKTENYKYIYIQTNKNTQIKNDIIRIAEKQNLKTFGFNCNNKLPIWDNLERTMKTMSKLAYFHHPAQMSYHNLCQTTQPPKGIGITLGLGLKFCIQSKTPPKNINKSYNIFIQDI